MRGQYFLTGSQNLALTGQVAEPLAGRAAMLRLLPISFREEFGRAFEPLSWETRTKNPAAVPIAPKKLWKNLLRRGYPELAAEPGRDIGLWHSIYAQTYLERAAEGCSTSRISRAILAWP